MKLVKLPLNAQSMPSHVSFNHVYTCHYDDQAFYFILTFWTLCGESLISMCSQSLCIHFININTANVSILLRQYLKHLVSVSLYDCLNASKTNLADVTLCQFLNFLKPLKNSHCSMRYILISLSGKTNKTNDCMFIG